VYLCRGSTHIFRPGQFVSPSCSPWRREESPVAVARRRTPVAWVSGMHTWRPATPVPPLTPPGGVSLLGRQSQEHTGSLTARQYRTQVR
jgi:hypothetical protein